MFDPPSRRRLPITAWAKSLAAALLLPALVGPVTDATRAQPGNPDEPTYKTGYKSIRMLGLTLWKALRPKFRKQIWPEPIFLDTDVTPFVHPVEYPGGPAPMRAVFVSAGFIDLVNNIAHAKAIDRIQRGYFKKYVLSLAQESGQMELKELPGLSDKRFWTDDVLNEQLSNFNQIVGVVVGIKLAHHYLGQFLKYQDRLKVSDPGQQLSINRFLTPQEWNAAFRCGVINALNCGLSVEGIEALYDAIDEMPKRPPWTVNFLPDNVKVKALRKELKKMERDFFSGKHLESGLPAKIAPAA